MTTKLEYRVKPVTRYTVTRYEDTGNTGSVTERGTFDNPDVAYEVAYALCKADHERLGYKVDDERVQYPEHPMQTTINRVVIANEAERVRVANGVSADELLRGARIVYDDGGPASITEYNTTGGERGMQSMPSPAVADRLVMTPPAGYVMLTKAEHERLVAAAGPHGVTKPMFEADRIKAEVDRTT